VSKAEFVRAIAGIAITAATRLVGSRDPTLSTTRRNNPKIIEKRNMPVNPKWAKASPKYPTLGLKSLPQYAQDITLVTGVL
jgi:hypothetical protein